MFDRTSSSSSSSPHPFKIRGGKKHLSGLMRRKTVCVKVLPLRPRRHQRYVVLHRRLCCVGVCVHVCVRLCVLTDLDGRTLSDEAGSVSLGSSRFWFPALSSLLPW